MRRTFPVLGALLALHVLAFADHNRSLPGKKVAVPPKIDGVVDAKEWESAAASSDFVHVQSGQKTPWNCTVYACYDSENLYFAFSNPDKEPNLIRATEYRRGASLDGNDYNIILINPFGTHQGRDASQFNVGAGGGMTAQFAGGRAAKREWEGEWESKSRITEQGWECEVRIPWKILRLPAGGKRDVEINFARNIPRAQMGISWCDIGDNERMDYNGSWQVVEVPTISESREILMLPYVIGGYDKDGRSEIINGGLDLRHQFNSQITGLGSINPDFRNVEGQVLGLAFSRFERLADEKRPFFVEGKNEFQLGGMSASLFSPQRIRSFDVGAKAFGKLNDKDSFGTLFTGRVGHETSGVARFHRAWGDQGGVTLGTVYWNDPDSGIQNQASEALVVQQGKTWGWDFVYDQTDDHERGTGRRMDVDLLYRNDNSFASFGYQAISEDFLPRIGFAPRTGYEGLNAFFQYQKAMQKGPWNSIELQSFAQDFSKEKSSDVYLRSLWTSLEGVTRSNLSLQLEFNYENFLGEEARFGTFSTSYPDNDPYHNYRVSYTAGSVGTTPYSLWTARANYRTNARVTFSPALQFERFGSTNREQHLLGISYEIDQHQSIGGRAVIRDKNVNWYMAYRKSGNLGAEYYLILGDPNAEKFQQRIIVKAVFPVNWKL